ncbi:hypothetical protein LCGC14_0591370 [marine sediment metagenome]|uniref:Uncharacterized protein n=1 Tax=marine sediment metagenome TaxID=412755 RepID=A0A0F9RDB8_9ZZZZ
MTTTEIGPTTELPPEVSAATTLIPYRKDDNRAMYLGYMACGFSDEEALFVLGLDRSWLKEVRQDGTFSNMEERMPELRKELSREYTELDFYRNFRMVLEKDHLILRKSLGMVLVRDEDTGEMVPEELSIYDHQYLLRLRSAYTPQQLQLLEAVTSSSESGFNFVKWMKDNQEVVEVSRTDKVVIKSKDG